MKTINNNAMTKTVFLLAALLLGLSINVAAKQFMSDDVSVSIRGQHNDKTYIVDGRRFHWDDLNEGQQQRVAEVEKRLEKAVAAVHIDTEKFEQFEQELTAEIEAIVELEELELLKEQGGLENMTIAEAKALASRVEQAVKQHEPKIKAIEAKIDELADIDMTEVDVIADEMELVLKQVAAELE